MNNWQLFPAKALFDEKSEIWDSLNQSLYQQHPLLDRRFAQSLITFYGDQSLLLALYGSAENGYSSALILQKRKRATWTTFLPSQAQIAPALCGDPHALKTLFKVLPGQPISIELLCQDPDYSFRTEALTTFDKMAHARPTSATAGKSISGFATRLK